MSRLQEIEEFASKNEFEDFRRFISDQIEDGQLEEIEPSEHFFGEHPLTKDRWFRDGGSSEVWRLVGPDFPFKGFFKKVTYPLDRAQNL